MSKITKITKISQTIRQNVQPRAWIYFTLITVLVATVSACSEPIPDEQQAGQS